MIIINEPYYNYLEDESYMDLHIYTNDHGNTIIWNVLYFNDPSMAQQAAQSKTSDSLKLYLI